MILVVKSARAYGVEGESVESLERRDIIVKNRRDGVINLNPPVLIGRHCHIEEDVSIKNSVIDNFCVVGKKTIIENSVIMDRTIIEEGAIIRDSIVGRHCRVKSSLYRPTVVKSTSVMGDDVTIGEGYLLSGTRIWPHMKLPSNLEIRNTNVIRPEDLLL